MSKCRKRCLLFHSPWPRQCYLPDLDWGAYKIRHRRSICFKNISTSIFSTSVFFHILKQLHFTMTGNRSISHTGNKPYPFGIWFISTFCLSILSHSTNLAVANSRVDILSFDHMSWTRSNL